MGILSITILQNVFRLFLVVRKLGSGTALGKAVSFTYKEEARHAQQRCSTIRTRGS